MSIKKNDEFAREVVGSVVGLLALMRPETPMQVENFMSVATRLIESQIKLRFEEVEAEADKTASAAIKAAQEGKKYE